MSAKKRKLRSRGLFWPVVLIVLGVVLLLNNLGELEEGVWQTILGLWPVLLVVIGVESLRRYGGLTGPFILAGIGLIFLLGNLGGLKENSFETMMRLWPLLLIALGLEIVVRGSKSWVVWLSFVLLLLSLGASLVFSNALVAF